MRKGKKWEGIGIRKEKIDEGKKTEGREKGRRKERREGG